MRVSFFLAAQLALAVVGHDFNPLGQQPLIGPSNRHDGGAHYVKEWPSEKVSYIDSLITNMTIEDLGMPVSHLVDTLCHNQLTLVQSSSFISCLATTL